MKSSCCALSSHRSIKAVQLAILSCWVFWAASLSLEIALQIPTHHLDGAYQTASGLYRLEAGQFPGRDFYPYLGVGPLFLLYPVFKAFGANVASSVFAAQFVVLMVGVIVPALLWHLLWRPKSFVSSLVAGALLFLLPVALTAYLPEPLPNWFQFGISPGNSLRPLRAAAPYVVVIAYYFFINKVRVPRRQYLWLGVLTGSALLWSNDFAIPSAALLALLTAWHAGTQQQVSFRNAAWYIGSFIISWTILISVTTLGHPIALLGYNFVDVAGDQWWFFGSYDATQRIFHWRHLGRLFSAENYLPSAVLIANILLSLHTRRLQHVLTAWIGVVLFLGGVLPSVGGHLGGYFEAFYFWAMMTATIGLLRLLWRFAYRPRTKHKPPKSRAVLALAVLLAASAALSLGGYRNWRAADAHMADNPHRFFVPELGGYLASEWQEYVDLARNTPTSGVYEEYWGIWSAIQKSLPTWPVDSIIHALGHARDVAAYQLPHANVIISTRHATSPVWQPWNLSQSYWFYRELIRQWTPVHQSPTTVVWNKLPAPRDLKYVQCQPVNQSRPLLRLDAPVAGFYEVNMSYEFSGDGRFLTMMQNNLSFGVAANGHVSIDPKGKHVAFPVFIARPDAATLHVKVIGHEPHNFSIASCSAKRIPDIDGDVLKPPGSSSEAFYISDNNWTRGVAKEWAGFFVPNTKFYAGQFRPGKRVLFADGDIRTILRVDAVDDYLNVYVDGQPLDPNEVGIPSAFRVQ